MASIKNSIRNSTNRRAFLKTGIAASAATMGTGLLDGGLSAFSQAGGDKDITKGDIAILKFLNALEHCPHTLPMSCCIN